jgi:nucleotide-binding universal stress UspA family protein
MFKEILIGLDGSESSLHALNYAAHLAKQDKAKLHVVTAVEPLPPLAYGGAGGAPAYMPQYQDDLHNGLEKMQKEQLEKLKQEYPTLEITGDVIDGRPAHVIRDAAGNADLIVIGHRGHGGILSWVLGSVAKEIVDGCSVPVLVVKDKDYC